MRSSRRSREPPRTTALTVSGGVPDLHAVAEVEDVTGLAPGRPQHGPGARHRVLGRPEQQGGVEVALDGDRAGPGPRLGDGDAPVHREHVEAQRGQPLEVGGGAGGEEDGRDAGLPDGRGDAREVGEAERLQVLAGQLAQPALEDLGRLGAGRDLRLQLDHRRPGELLEQRVGRRRIAPEQRLEPREPLAAALDRVARHRERPAHEADERHAAGQRPAGGPDALQHEGEIARRVGDPQRLHVGAGPDRVGDARARRRPSPSRPSRRRGRAPWPAGG